MSIASREAKWTMPSRIRPGQEALGQYRIDLVRAAARPACRTRGNWSGIRNGAERVLGSTPSRTGRITWGITSPARITSTRSPYADVLLRDQLLVVQRRGCSP